MPRALKLITTFLIITVLTSVLMTLPTLNASSGGSGRVIRVPQDCPSVRGAVFMAEPGDVVVISNGTYIDFIYIENKHDLGIIGEGNVTLNIDRRNDFVVYIKNSRNITISGLSFTRAKKYNIIIENSTSITIEGVKTYDSVLGIYIVESRDILIKDSWVNYTVRGIGIEKSEGLSIVNTEIINSAYEAIEAEGVSNIVIDGVKSENTTGIDLTGVVNATLRNLILKSLAEHFGLVADISLWGVKDVAIEDSTLLGGGLEFIDIDSIPEVSVKNVSVRGAPLVFLRDKDFEWASLKDTYEAVGQIIAYNVSRLIIEGYSFTGLWVAINVVRSSNILITNNRFVSNPIETISLTEVTNVTIFNNEITVTRSAIAVVDSKNIVIYNNNISRVGSGISIARTKDIIIYRNMFRGMGWSAVDGVYDSDLLMFGNSVINVHENTFLSGSKMVRFFSDDELTYVYGGKEFRSRIGNYWSLNVNATDNDGDGLSDIPYTFLLVSSDVFSKVTDKYPLIKPHTNYTLPPLLELPKVEALGKEFKVYAGNEVSVGIAIENPNAVARKYIVLIKAPKEIGWSKVINVTVKPCSKVIENITIPIPKGIKEGKYGIEVVVKDTWPLPKTETSVKIPLVVMVDNEPPVIDAEVSVSDGLVTIKWLVKDNYEVGNVTLTMGKESISVEEEGTKSIKLKPGTYEVIIVATDKAGNKATYKEKITIKPPTTTTTTPATTSTSTTTPTTTPTSTTETTTPAGPSLPIDPKLAIAVIISVLIVILISKRLKE